MISHYNSDSNLTYVRLPQYTCSPQIFEHFVYYRSLVTRTTKITRNHTKLLYQQIITFLIILPSLIINNVFVRHFLSENVTKYFQFHHLEFYIAISLCFEIFICYCHLNSSETNNGTIEISFYFFIDNYLLNISKNNYENSLIPIIAEYSIQPNTIESSFQHVLYKNTKFTNLLNCQIILAVFILFLIVGYWY